LLVKCRTADKIQWLLNSDAFNLELQTTVVPLSDGARLETALPLFSAC